MLLAALLLASPLPSHRGTCKKSNYFSLFIIYLGIAHLVLVYEHVPAEISRLQSRVRHKVQLADPI